MEAPGLGNAVRAWPARGTLSFTPALGRFHCPAYAPRLALGSGAASPCGLTGKPCNYLWSSLKDHTWACGQEPDSSQGLGIHTLAGFKGRPPSARGTCCVPASPDAWGSSPTALKSLVLPLLKQAWELPKSRSCQFRAGSAFTELTLLSSPCLCLQGEECALFGLHTEDAHAETQVLPSISFFPLGSSFSSSSCQTAWCPGRVSPLSALSGLSPSLLRIPTPHPQTTRQTPNVIWPVQSSEE